MNIYKLMNIAQEELKRRLPEDQETDDWTWSEDSFSFVILSGTTEDFEEFEVSEPYCFHYRPDDRRCGKTPEEQLMRWLDKYF